MAIVSSIFVGTSAGYRAPAEGVTQARGTPFRIEEKAVYSIGEGGRRAEFFTTEDTEERGGPQRKRGRDPVESQHFKSPPLRPL